MSARDKAIAVAIAVVMTGMTIAVILEPILDGPVYSSYSKEAP